MVSVVPRFALVVPRFLFGGALFGSALLGCSTAPAQGKVPSRKSTLSCPRGAFAAELDTLMPQLFAQKTVDLVPPAKIDTSIEPGCIVPFRREPDERFLDAGRVEVFTTSRTKPEKQPHRVGRGNLKLGRGSLELDVHNDGGDETLFVSLKGSHVVLRSKGDAPLDLDVNLESDTPLPLPLDALVASLDKCDADERTGKSVDGNQIEAKRGNFMLYRGRFLDTQATLAIDTSVMCGGGDARLAWRTASGDTLPFLLVASARSDRTMLIQRQPGSKTESGTDPGVIGH